MNPNNFFDKISVEKQILNSDIVSILYKRYLFMSLLIKQFFIYNFFSNKKKKIYLAKIINKY